MQTLKKQQKKQLNNKTVNFNLMRAEQIPSAFFYKGINDSGLTKLQPGTVADYSSLKVGEDYIDPDNFAKAYAISIEKMQAAYPDAQIFCMTLLPHNYSSYLVDDTASLVDAYNACIKMIADYYGIIVIDIAAESGITWENLSAYMKSDGIHPNKLGMDLIADVLIKALEDIYVD